MSTRMSPREQKDFLTETKCIAKLSTLDKDGSIHIVPVWYMYDGENYIMTSDTTSHHVKNIRRNNDATLLIDTVQFPTKGVRIKGSAALEEDGREVHGFEGKITERYIPDKGKAAEYVKKREGMSKRLAIILTPEKVSNWDFSKDVEVKEFFKDSPIYSLNEERP